MADSDSDRLRQTFETACGGDPRAAEALLPLVYDELRRLARSLISRRAPGRTLQPTALVHEAYLRVAGSDERDWNDRRHFFAVAALAMRQILVDEARRRGALKRGGGRERFEVRDDDFPVESPVEDVVALGEAVDALESAEPRCAQIVNLHFFAGLTFPETAEVLGLSQSTVERDWRFARAWLLDRLGGEVEAHDWG